MFDKLFSRFCKKEEAKKDVIAIHEDLTSIFRYHIAINGEPLCGYTRTIQQSIPLAAWGMKTHLRETYCQVCAERARARGILRKMED